MIQSAGQPRHRNVGNQPLDEVGKQYREIVVTAGRLPGETKPMGNLAIKVKEADPIPLSEGDSKMIQSAGQRGARRIAALCLCLSNPRKNCPEEKLRWREPPLACRPSPPRGGRLLSTPARSSHAWRSATRHALCSDSRASACRGRRKDSRRSRAAPVRSPDAVRR